MVGGVHGRGACLAVGVCMAGDMRGRGCAWWGGMHGRVGACVADTTVDSYKCVWAFIGGFKRFSGLQSSLGITNVNRSHNKPLELIETI